MSSAESLQDDWMRARSRDDRRRSGQFFTPRWIARCMARWLLDAAPRTILDPAFGFGILVDECVRQGFDGTATGYEIDQDIVRAWKAAGNAGHGTTLENVDFFHADARDVEAAIANPPYNRFQNRDLPPEVQHRLRKLLGRFASGYTNQYALFLYLVISQLRLTGRAAFIVPSEFLATGYGVQVKRFLIDSQRLKHLILFDTNTRVFPEAATTACILLFDRGLQTDLSVWHLTGETQANHLHAICSGEGNKPAACIPYDKLEPEANWQNLGSVESDFGGLVRLDVFGRTKRGIATGANEFFAVGSAEIDQHGLGEDDLVPCIASADSAPRPYYSRTDWQALAASGRPTHLFNGLSGTGAAKRYIALGERAGFHLRYLTRTRSPWYRLEQRPPAPLLLAVFGRGGFRAVLNRAGVSNLTAFHGFYPAPGHQKIVELLWLYLQTPLAQAAFQCQQRSYGDGLKKLEPGDWNALLVPDWNLWPESSLLAAQAMSREAVDAEQHDDRAKWDNTIAGYAALVESHRREIADSRTVHATSRQMSLLTPATKPVDSHDRAAIQPARD